MPESYLWLLNHVGNTFGLSTKQHKFTQLRNTWNETVTVKRISSSSWCVWGLGHDHRVYIYVFSSDVPIRVPDTLYENQRYLPFHGFSQSGLLPMDRYAWSDEKGIKDTPKESFRLPSAHWTWEGNWMVDENLRGEVAGVEGWQYAVDFPSSHYTPEKHWNTCVRKRKWIRFRRFTSTDVWVRISDMEVVESSECFIDVSIGGFYLPSQPDGFLSVWAVTNSGRVFVRTKVCHEQPEGVAWKEIGLGSNLGVINICVGASNLVWAITWDGQALVRTGVNRNKIHGTQWEIVECPDESSRLMQVAVGKNVVWALSREGKVWFRKGTCADDIQGNISSYIGSMWVEMVGNMSCISISANDQVFAIDANDGGVYFRTGITSSNQTGKMWQKISLHEDISVFEAMTSEACTCSADTTMPGTCEVHKRRHGSFTTSCSSSSTWTEEPSSDALLSPQSPETVLPSDAEHSNDTNNHEECSSNEKDPSNISQTQTTPTPYESQDILKEAESSSVNVVYNFESNVTNDEVTKVDIPSKNDTDGDSLLKVQPIPDQNFDSIPCTESPVNTANSHDCIEQSELQQPSGETKIQSFVEELTEVDRFLVETEILQSSQAPFSSQVLSDSPELPKICDYPNEVSDVVISSEMYGGLDSRDSDHNENNRDKLDEKSVNGHKSLAHSNTDSGGPIKPNKHKHVKSKHAKRPEHLPLEDETDSIVYKTPKGKKKKRKSGANTEFHRDVVDESKQENNINPIDAVSLVEKVCQSNIPPCQIEELEEPSQLVVVESVEDTKDNVGEDNNVTSERLDHTNKDCVPTDSQIEETEPISLQNQGTEETAVNELSSSPKTFSENVNLDMNHDVRFEDDIVRAKNKSENEPSIKRDSLDPPPEDARRFSLDLDSPVSDRIFDFVSFVDEENDNEKVFYTSDTKELAKVTYAKASPLTPDYNDNPDVWKEPPSYAEVTQSEEKQTFSELAQLIPIQPAMKIFKYRSTPSPGIPSNPYYASLDPEILSQTRYAWRSLDVTALHVDDPSTVRWLHVKKKDLDEKKNAPKIKASLRNEILSKLKARNRREIYQYHNFEQAVKNTSWVKKSAMKTFVRRGGGQWVSCSVELEQNKSDQSDKCLTVVYSSKNHQKVKPVTLKDVTCIKRSTKPDLIRTTFIIYSSTDPQNPIVLQAASETEAVEWISLLCSASASQCNLDQPIPAGSLWSCSKSGDILVSPSNTVNTKSGQFCWGLHGGHMHLIETGSCGVTWAIGFDRMTYVYNGGFGGAVCLDVPGMGNNLQEMTDSHQVYVFEHQMRFPVVGWCSKGMLGNNFNWTTETGQSLASRDDVKLPSSKWQWVSSWTVDFNTSGGVNSEGWQFSTVLGDFHPSQHVKDMHRRRRWVRTCRLNTQGPWMSAGSLSLHDISIQIDPVTSSNDVIVLWAIGTNGDVLCRYGVTQDNTLGQSWIHIPTDLDKPFVSISVGGGWRVWGIASDGSTWYRSGVSRYSPSGKCWLQVVESPTGSGILRQVSAGATAVWAVDTEDILWRRRNITRTFPEGTDWEQVAPRVKRVSVGPNDQVWIVTDSRFNNSHESSGCIYRRVGISESKPGGTKWEKVIGLGSRSMNGIKLGEGYVGKDGWSHISIRSIKGQDS